MIDELATLEDRVTRKWLEFAANRVSEWDLPDNPFDLGEWTVDIEPLPDDWPQFPREQWASYPTKRRLTLMMCDRLLDFDELTEEQWMQLCFLMQYGGKTRLA